MTVRNKVGDWCLRIQDPKCGWLLAAYPWNAQGNNSTDNQYRGEFYYGPTKRLAAHRLA
jgi:hypothetical protein